MTLVLPNLIQQFSDTTKQAAKKAAEEAFFKSMRLDYPGDKNFLDFQRDQSKLFAKVFSEVFDAHFSTKMAQHIDLYIKSATIVVPPGQLVTVAGSPSAQTGATVAPSPNALIS